jgi:cellulose synthase (UDP-forming)
LQTLFLKSGPLGPGRLSLWKRLVFLPIDWIVHPAVRLLAILVPIIYLWTGVGPFVIPSINDLLFYQLPVLIAVFGVIRWFAPDSYMPFLSSATTLFNSFRIVPAGIGTFIKPFGTPFRVTPKGSSIQFSFGDMTVLGLSVGLIVLTVAALIKHRFVPSGVPEQGILLVLAETWALINVAVLALVALIAIESPRPRKEERFPTNQPARYRVAQQEFRCRIRDISVSGALLEIIEDGEAASSGAESMARPCEERTSLGNGVIDGSLELVLDDTGPLSARVVRNHGPKVAIHFAELGGEERDRLIRYIYASGRSNAVSEVRGWNIIRSLARNIIKE